jgi:hypothetical protein
VGTASAAGFAVAQIHHLATLLAALCRH